MLPDPPDISDSLRRAGVAPGLSSLLSSSFSRHASGARHAVCSEYDILSVTLRKGENRLAACLDPGERSAYLAQLDSGLVATFEAKYQQHLKGLEKTVFDQVSRRRRHFEQVKKRQDQYRQASRKGFAKVRLLLISFPLFSSQVPDLFILLLSSQKSVEVLRKVRLRILYSFPCLFHPFLPFELALEAHLLSPPSTFAPFLLLLPSPSSQIYLVESYPNIAELKVIAEHIGMDYKQTRVWVSPLFSSSTFFSLESIEEETRALLR